MNKTVKSIIKTLVSIGLGVLIIVLVARNFSKPLKMKLDSPAFKVAESWTLSQWEVEPPSYIYVGDTMAVFTSPDGQSEALLSIYEGDLVQLDTKAGTAITAGTAVAKVKVDIWKIIREAFKRTNYWWLALSLIISLLSHLLRAIRWKMMFKPLGYHPSLGNTFGAVLVNYFANLALPRLGEVLRCSIVARYEQIPLQKSFGTMITERVVDVFCLGGVFLLCLALQGEIFNEFSQNYMPKSGGGNLKFVILGVGILGAGLTYLLYRSGKLPFADKIRELVRGLWEGVSSIKDMERPWLFVVFTVVIWTMYWLMTAVCLKALPETSHLSLLAGLPILFFGGIAMVAVQGGLGLYPYFVAKILVLYGIVETTGYAFGWIIWTAQTALVIVAGSVAFLLLALLNKERV